LILFPSVQVAGGVVDGVSEILNGTVQFGKSGSALGVNGSEELLVGFSSAGNSVLDLGNDNTNVGLVHTHSVVKFNKLL